MLYTRQFRVLESLQSSSACRRQPSWLAVPHAGRGTLDRSILDNGPSLDDGSTYPESSSDPASTSSSRNPRQERRKTRKRPPRNRMAMEYGYDWGEVEPETEWDNEIPPQLPKRGGLWGRQQVIDDEENTGMDPESESAPQGSSFEGKEGDDHQLEDDLPFSSKSRWSPPSSSFAEEGRGAGPGGRARIVEPFADVLSGTRERARRRDEGRWGPAPYPGNPLGPGSAEEEEEGYDNPSDSEPVTAQLEPLSDIVLLSRRDTERVLPVVPNGKQADYYQPKSLQERVVMLLGSLGATMMLSKATVLAAPTLLYPLWSPWLRAGFRNLELYAKQFKVVGLWRAKVIEAEVKGIDWMNYAMGGVNGANAGGKRFVNGAPFDQPYVKLVVGDGWEGGARVELEFPFQPRAEMVRPGDEAELLVLCQDEAFVSFKVVRELYLPQSALWLADYPFVDRVAFLDISLSIERTRQEEADREERVQDGSGDVFDDTYLYSDTWSVASYEESDEEARGENVGSESERGSRKPSSAWNENLETYSSCSCRVETP